MLIWQFGDQGVERAAKLGPAVFGFGKVAQDLGFPFGKRFDFTQHQACAFDEGNWGLRLGTEQRWFRT